MFDTKSIISTIIKKILPFADVVGFVKCVGHGDVVGAVQLHPVTEDVIVQVVAPLDDAW